MYSMYIFYPAGGMGNRMRAIDSAYRFCKQHNKSFKIYWWRYPGVDVAFTDVFQPLDTVKDTYFNWVNVFDKIRRKSILGRFVLRCLEKMHILRVLNANEYEELFKWVDAVKKGYKRDYLFHFISSFSAFDLDNMYDFQRQLFVLQDALKHKVELETVHFTEYTIGVHIRRTDNQISIEHSPLELFESRMQRELDNNAQTTFYIASDAADVKEYFKHKFGKHVLLPTGVLNNSSQEGIKQGMVELYALARTKGILGSYYSSFSTAAAMIGNIPKETVSNNS